MSVDLFAGFLEAAVRTTTPLLLAALGVLVAYRAGVLIVGAEGMMLAGSLAAAWGAFATGTPWLGLLAAMVVGALLGAVFAAICVYGRADQVVVGIALNLALLGLTTTIGRVAAQGQLQLTGVPGFKPVPLPGLARLPLLGPVLFTHLPLVYVTLLLVLLCHLLLFRTRAGLILRAVGEHPAAAESSGLNVLGYRLLACVVCGALAGAAGAHLSVGLLNRFTENMVAGRGFISLAAVILGGWQPLGTLGASLLFGAAEALQIRLQAFGSPIPYQVLLALPHVVTVVTLVLFAARREEPAATAQPYPPLEGA